VTQSGPVMERDRDYDRDRGRSAIETEADAVAAFAAVGMATAAAAAAATARVDAPGAPRVEVAERDVRAALRGQIARLERESSAIVADGFPHISPAGRLDPADVPGSRHEVRADVDAALAGPRLLTLAELERVRDRLVGLTQDLRRLAAERIEHERRARELLEAMRLEPGSYRFVRLPVRDLGEGGCGVWEVRPRLGLIGMLTGWWQVKLSSGCP
jgi:hypothetical protein